jgi:hypothetical protein
MNKKTKLILIEILTAIVFAGMLFVPRIPQDPAYHLFADKRMFFGVPNFFDVISNIPFIVIGFAGMLELAKNLSNMDQKDRIVNICYLVFFISIFLTGFGSGYYHLNPDNATNVWDRLPLAVSFMSLFAAILYERIELKGGPAFLAALVLFGIFSIVYWYITELKGRGDLRPYIIVQFYPMLLIPFIILYLPSRFTRANDLWVMSGFYGLAKIFELFDKQIFRILRSISGHTFKHIFAALAVFWVLRMVQKRKMKIYD